MKTNKIFFSLLFFCFSLFASAQQPTVKKEVIQVSGNCEMCKSTIEKAAKSAGASFASWNTETKKLSVRYVAGKTDGKKIQQAVAKSGYDTELFTATNEAYDKLHGCCKYDRTKSDSSNVKQQQ